MRSFLLLLVVLPACATPGRRSSQEQNPTRAARPTKTFRNELEFAGGVNEITNSSSADSDLGWAGEVLSAYMLNEWAEFGGFLTSSHGKVDSDDPPESGRFTVDQGFELTEITVGPIFRANLPIGTALIPFAEGAVGFGTAWVEGDVSTNNASVHVDSSEWVLFYQVGVGLRWLVTEKVAIVGLGRYRWLDISDVSETIETTQVLVGVSLAY